MTGVGRRRWLVASGHGLLTAAVAIGAGRPAKALAQALPAPQDLSGLPALIARVKPSVLPVGTYSATDSPRFGFSGTGFAVGDGSLIASCFHVLPSAGAGVEANRRLAVIQAGPNGISAVRAVKLVASDPARDLALLQLDGGPPLAPLELDEPETAREGLDIALVGFPIGGLLGFASVTHRGIVASVTTAALPAPAASQLDSRAVNQLRQGNFKLLQLDATAYPGNSGGPVFDVRTGRVVGIVNMVLLKSNRESAIGSPTGISYAVPVEYLRALMALPR